MNILLANTYDSGGAAKACLRLHEGLLKQSQQSRLLLKNRRTNENLIHAYSVSHRDLEVSFKTYASKKARHLLRAGGFSWALPDTSLKCRPKGLELFSYPFSNYDLLKSNLYRQADIVNLHWVADFLNYTTFFKRNYKPVVWTLHDQNPFLGLEHYAETIIGIDDRGYPVSRRVSECERTAFAKYVRLKKRALQHCPHMHLVAPSRWMHAEAANSELFSGYPVTTIPYGLDSEIYKPLDKSLCRDVFSIPQSAIVILFVAHSVRNIRKGYVFLQRAIEQLNCHDVVLLCVGTNKGSVYPKHNNVMDIGAIVDERMMSLVYSAADVFVAPSLMDNLPNTVLESLMCGTPVIGFPVGGIPDMVQEGENGYLVPEISVSALVNTIARFIDNPSVFDRSHVRANAVDKYDLPIQAAAYIKLFHSLLSGH